MDRGLNGRMSPSVDHLLVLVVSRNSTRWLSRCLLDLATACDLGAETVVVDNASGDGSAALVRSQFPTVALVSSPINLGFAGGANLGLRVSNAEIVVILNPDVEVQPSTITNLVAALEASPRAAIAGAKLLYPDGKTIQHAGGRLSYPLALASHDGYGEAERGQYDELREVEYVTGALFAVKRAVLDEVGCFDEGFYPAYFEEADLCYRARQAGYSVLYVPQAVAVHHESVTIGKHTFQHYHYYHRNRLRYILKHYTDAQLWDDVLPAELQRLRDMESEVELAAVHRAYADNLAVLEGRADFIVNPDGAASLPSSPRRLQTMKILGALAALCLKRQVVERPFVSNTPLVGPLIVGGRRLWNWMSTKWYVRALVQQQNDFNAQVIDALRALIQSLPAMETSSFEPDRGSTAHDADLASLEHRLARLEERFAYLHRSLGDPPEPNSPRT